MFYRALELGMTVGEFWDATPRVIVMLGECAREAHGGKGKRGVQAAQVQRLNRLPRG